MLMAQAAALDVWRVCRAVPGPAPAASQVLQARDHPQQLILGWGVCQPCMVIAVG